MSILTNNLMKNFKTDATFLKKVYLSIELLGYSKNNIKLKALKKIVFLFIGVTLSSNIISQQINTTKKIVKGNVFFDANANGIKDIDENAIENFKLYILPSKVLINTDYNGDYSVELDAGKYYILPITSKSYFKSIPFQDTVLINNDGVPNPTHNFAIQKNKDTIDFNFYIDNNMKVKQGNDLILEFSCKNVGTKAFNGILKILFDSTTLSYVKDLDYFKQLLNNDTLIMPIYNIKPFDKYYFTTRIKVNSNIPLGLNVNFKLFVNATTDDFKHLTKTDSINILVVNEFEPIQKEVFPTGENDALPINTDKLIYTIRFQNTGKDTATNIEIKDTLSDKLAFGTFCVISSSHKYTYIIKNGVVTFSFKNILMPDTSKSSYESNGFIRYSISPLDNLTNDTEIENTAYICFDTTRIAKTNTTKSLLKKALSVESISKTEDDIYIYPNPAKDDIAIYTSKSSPLYYTNIDDIKIYDLQGRNVKILNIKTINDRINVTDLKKGFYFVKINTNNNIHINLKFLKN